MMNFKHITYRPGRKCYQVLIRKDGKTYSKTCKTITEALEIRNNYYKLLDLNVDILSTKKELVAPKAPTFKEAYTAYIEHIEKMKQITPSTVYTYKRAFNVLAPYVGKILITEINAEMWNDVLVNLQNNLLWSKDYTKHLANRVKAMYDYFMPNFPAIASNPCENFNLIQTKKKKNQPVFSEQEKEEFLKNVKIMYGNRWLVLFRLYFQTGCRKGELLALKWQDVDFDNKTIDINKSISKGTIHDKYQEYVGKTKTVVSNRIIPISDKMALTLLSLKNVSDGKESDFVFKCLMTENGKYDFLTLSRIDYVFADIRKKSKINQTLHVHSIRHYFATKLMLAGVDLKTVMALGGWSKSSTLIEIYTHATIDSKRNAMNAVIF